MDRVIFGDNQFFAVNHLSDDKAREQAIRFRTIESITNVLDYVYDIGIRTFMCTTHARMYEISEHIRKHETRFEDFSIYPCLPYAHKYNNAVADLGMLGALKKFAPEGIVDSVAKGGLAFLKKDYEFILTQLIDAEVRMFEGLNCPTIFLQNIVTDLILGLGMHNFFSVFAEHVKSKHNAEAGFITMNLPALSNALAEEGIQNPIICASINKIGYRMTGGIEANLRCIKEDKNRIIAMQTLAAGAIRPTEAMQYVSSLDGVDSILFGASTKSHIKETYELIVDYSKDSLREPLHKS